MHNKNKEFLKFIVVGGLNASIYFLLLTLIESVSGNRYFALVASQTLISIIAFHNFARYSFNVALRKITFFKFLGGNLCILALSALFAYVLEPYNLNPYVFGLIIILMVTPISYILNSKFVFVKGVRL